MSTPPRALFVKEASPATLASPRPAPSSVRKISARSMVPKAHGMRFVESFQADVTARYARICNAIDQVRGDEAEDDDVVAYVRNVRSFKDQLKYHFANILDLLSLSDPCAVRVRILFLDMAIEKIKRDERPSYQELLELIKFTRILLSISKDPDIDKTLEKYLRILQRILADVRGHATKLAPVRKVDTDKLQKKTETKRTPTKQANETNKKAGVVQEPRVRNLIGRNNTRYGTGIGGIMVPYSTPPQTKQQKQKEEQSSPGTFQPVDQANLAGIKLGKPVRKKDSEWEESDGESSPEKASPLSSPRSPRIVARKRERSEGSKSPRSVSESETKQSATPKWKIVSGQSLTIQRGVRTDTGAMTARPVLGFSDQVMEEIDGSLSEISWLDTRSGSFTIERGQSFMIEGTKMNDIGSCTTEMNEQYEASVKERITSEVRKEFEERSREFEENLRREYEERSRAASEIELNSSEIRAGFSLVAEEIDIAPNKKDIAKDICKQMLKAAQKIRRKHELADDLAELEGLERAGMPALRLSDIGDEEYPLTLSARISRGMKLFDPMNPQDKARILELARLFTVWAESYEASHKVWEVMKEDQSFELDALLSQIPVTFADFLVEAIKTFSFEESLDVSDSLPPDDTLFY